MKFLAKHPLGPTYELTREELQAPAVVRQLGIDESWQIRAGTEWVSLAMFLDIAPEKLITARQFRKSRATDQLLSPTAPWTPGATFALLLRMVGLFLLLEAFQVLLTILCGVTALRNVATQLPGNTWGAALLWEIGYVGAGLYLLLSPHAIVARVFAANLGGNPSAADGGAARVEARSS